MKSCVEFFAGVSGITIGVLAIVATATGLMFASVYFISALITMLGG